MIRAPCLYALLLFLLAGSCSSFDVPSTYECARGFDCIGLQLNVTAPVQCFPGMYCPGGDARVEWCPQQDFCPDGSYKSPCTAGNYCPYASSQELECSFGGICPAASYAENNWFGAIVVLPFCAVALGMWLASCVCTKRTRRKVKPADMTLPTTDLDGKVLGESEKLHIQFSNLQVVVQTQEERKVILKNVTGEFRPGRLTAIMGSSGAGKSTLMSVILGRVPVTSGKVLVNGKAESLARYSKVMGYVPQDDILAKNMTVRAALQHSADYRLPADWPAYSRKSIVERALDSLNLRKVERTLIRYLSGSERKRVSIGVEIVADPYILFLDEPTTGLDAASSQDIVEALQRIAQFGMTVIAVLHQPRFEIIQLFDDLLLLGTGGFSAYVGPTSGCMGYFNSLGFELPRNVNPGDFFLDVLSCRATRTDGAPATLEFLEDSGRRFTEDKDMVLAPAPSAIMLSTNTEFFRVQSTVLKIKKKKQSVECWAPIRRFFMGSGDTSLRRTPGFWRQLGFYLRKSGMDMYESNALLGGNILAMILIAACFGGGFSGGIPYWPVIPPAMVTACPFIVRERCETEPALGYVVYLVSFYLTMVAGACWAVGAVPTFGNGRAVYYREMSTGANPSSYFVAKCMLDVITIVIAACLFTALFVLILGPAGGVAQWFGLMIAMCWAAFGVGYIVGCLVSRDQALVISAVVAIACAVTCGFTPTIQNVRDRYGPLQIIWDVSYNRWAGEGMVILLTTDYRTLGYDVNTELIARGYDPYNYATDVGILILLGFTHRFVAFVSLRSLKRSKQN